MSATNTQQIALHKNIDQLQRELRVERVKISTVCADLANYCEQRRGEDYLLSKELAPGQTNPYKEKRGLCNVI